MILRHFIRPQAEADIDDCVAYLEEQSSFELASRFLSAVESTIGFLYKTPLAGARYAPKKPRLKQLRTWPVQDFADIRIYYQLPDEATMRIIRVLHGKRNVKRILLKEDL